MVTKWRPLQCFVALTDTLHADEGGFEAARGFHRDFDEWVRTRPPPPLAAAASASGDAAYPSTPLCVGEFTPIRPKEDADVLRRVAHVPCRAGDLVVWDNRIPHANSRENNASGGGGGGGGGPGRSREVVYLGFLPDVPLNRTYAAAQLARFRSGQPPQDQWQEQPQSLPLEQHCEDFQFSSLGRRLMGIDPWV